VGALRARLRVTRRIVISTGDPAGIGPEVVLKALAASPPRTEPLVAGDPRRLGGGAAPRGGAPQ
jgi:4-hydroxy-L-threonine phosphate dehydrogenase PdxA